MGAYFTGVEVSGAGQPGRRGEPRMPKKPSQFMGDCQQDAAGAISVSVMSAVQSLSVKNRSKAVRQQSSTCQSGWLRQT